MKKENYIPGLLDFLHQSPGCYHAADSIRQRMDAAGFHRLYEQDVWKLQPGESYYVIRGSSSILSFHLSESRPNRMRLMASHSDSPSFKLKPGKALMAEGLTRLNVEKYGGAIVSSWFDRPLSAAGRVMVQENGHIVSKLVYWDRDLCLIPSLAIHLSGSEKELSLQNHLLPVVSGDGNELILDALLSEQGIDAASVLGMDLFLTCRMEPTVWGANNEFLSAPRLDDLACAYGTMEGFLAARNSDDLLMHCVFDNEEVGSESKQGAASTFLRDVTDRICCALDLNADERAALMARSVLISSDNAHAAHPGYPGVSDPVDRPRMNGGIVLKHHAGQKYTTDAYSAALVRQLCRQADVPVQDYANHSDQRGGSTLGNISNTQISLNAADIGLAQLAMHSAYETMGAEDPEYLVRFSEAFYSLPLPDLK